MKLRSTKLIAGLGGHEVNLRTWLKKFLVGIARCTGLHRRIKGTATFASSTVALEGRHPYPSWVVTRAGRTNGCFLIEKQGYLISSSVYNCLMDPREIPFGDRDYFV